MARDLLIEIGTEELPASFMTSALSAMPAIAEDLLGRARLVHGPMQAMGTPRRLALRIEDIADTQPDLEEEVLGPPRSVAHDAEGRLTKAAEGFARKQGVALDALRIVETDKGEYLAARRLERGRPAQDVLPEVLATLCGRIPFPKSMRWGAGDIAFGRPVHWIVALRGESIVPVEFAGVVAGRTSRGHRFLAPGPIELADAGAYVDALRNAHVRVQGDERRERMHDALVRAATDMGGTLVPDAFLLDECASLVEEPHVVPGRFDESFLDLPEGVIVSVLRDHQRYFAVRDGTTGKLLPRYLNVANTANDPETIALGNDRVLRARLADARFFVDEDRKSDLRSRVAGLDRIVFQKKLGSLGDKVRRMSALATSLVPEALAKQVRLATELCKADLSTSIVGEFPELQGEMGRYYALEQSVDPGVADALRDHYLPRGAGDRVPVEPVGAAVAIADRADTLAGCFGIGLMPTGSADPFALRRAALGIVRIALEGPMDVALGELIARAHDGYPGGALAARDESLDRIEQFFRARLKAFYADAYPADVIEACLGAWQGGSIRDLGARIKAIAAFRELPEYESLAVAFKRAFNIAKDAPEGDVDPNLLEHEAEHALALAFSALRPGFDSSVARGAYDEALGAVARELRQPIDRFFEEVFVMVDDEDLRLNRLRLLGGIARALTGIAHFHHLAT